MSFEERYKLLEAVADLNHVSDQELLGREIATGRPVVAHLLGSAHSAANDALLKKLDELSPGHKAFVLEIGEYRDRPCVVTLALPGSLSLRNWIDRIPPPQPPLPAGTRVDELRKVGMWKVPVRSDPRAEAKPEPGEFTRLLQTPIQAEAPAPLAPKQEPGEFTRMVQASRPPSEEITQSMETPLPPQPTAFTLAFQTPIQQKVSATPIPPWPLPVSSTPPEPGEFTRLFQSPVEPKPAPKPAPQPISAPPPPPPPAAPQAAPSAGEFTRMFQSPAQPAPAPASPPAAHSPLNQAEPGEFTRMFESPVSSTPGWQPAPATPAPQGEFTRMLDPFRPPVGAPAPGYHANFPPTPVPASAPSSGQGEFTRMFGSEAAAGSPAPQFSSRPAGVEATQAFSTPAPAPASPAPPVQEGPGEYTRMFGTPAITPPPAPAKPALAPKKVEKPVPDKTSYTLLIVVLAVLFLIAVAVVLVFALRA